MRTLPKRFHLLRTKDIHGSSGTGIVAEGVCFNNGYCALTWLTHLTSVAVYHSADVLEKIHSHNGDGNTILVWDDSPRQLQGYENDAQ